jgi:hypothetical protein
VILKVSAESWLSQDIDRYLTMVVLLVQMVFVPYKLGVYRNLDAPWGQLGFVPSGMINPRNDALSGR